MNALTSSFQEAAQFRCDIHMRDNVKTQCEKLKISKFMSDEIQDDILGSRNGSSRICV